MYSHLEGQNWGKWKEAFIALEKCLQDAIIQMEKDAAAHRAMQKGGLQQSSLFGIGRPTALTHQLTAKGIETRSATWGVSLKYTEVERTLLSFQPYHPISLTFFEPVNSAERYHWLAGLQLSVPIAMIKAQVGGSLGTLVWILRRDQDEMENGDESALHEAQSLIQPLIPQVHGIRGHDCWNLL